MIASAFTTRNGVEDCKSYLRATYTPATSTFYETAIPTVTAEAVTITTTIEAGSVLKPRDEAADLPAQDRRDLLAEKRQEQAGGTTFPAYASACTSFAKYSSACSCVGVSPETITVDAPSTTITETQYTTVVPTATATVINIVRNGGFETNRLSPWTITRGPRYVPGAIAAGGSASSAYRLLSNSLNNNDLFEVWQTLHGEAGTTYRCSYDWKFTHYYETRYSDGYTYVPYIHGYVNDDIWTNDRPSVDTLDVWQTTTFTYTSSGSDVWWFDCASPQARGNRAGQGPNYVSLDNFVCVAV